MQPAQFPANGLGTRAVRARHIRSIFGQILRQQLIDRLIMHGQMRALGASVSDVHQQVPRELTLNVQIPLLNVWGRVVDRGRFVAIALNIDQRLVSPEGRGDSARERIEQSGSSA